MKERDGVNEINKVCKAVISLFDSDFIAMDEVIKSQEEYNHPLKMGTVTRQQELAKHNRAVVRKLAELREIIANGAGI